MVNFAFKRILAKNCKSYGTCSEVIHQSCAKVAYWLMLRGKTSCLLPSQLDLPIDFADFWSYDSKIPNTWIFKKYARWFSCTAEEKIKMQACNIWCGWIAQVLKMLNIQNEWLLWKCISLASGLYVTLTHFEQHKWLPVCQGGMVNRFQNVTRILTLTYQQRK